MCKTVILQALYFSKMEFGIVPHYDKNHSFQSNFTERWRWYVSIISLKPVIEILDYFSLLVQTLNQKWDYHISLN